jgi:hypothetical protein
VFEFIEAHTNVNSNILKLRNKRNKFSHTIAPALSLLHGADLATSGVCLQVVQAEPSYSATAHHRCPSSSRPPITSPTTPQNAPHARPQPRATTTKLGCPTRVSLRHHTLVCVHSTKSSSHSAIAGRTRPRVHYTTSAPQHLDRLGCDGLRCPGAAPGPDRGTI